MYAGGLRGANKPLLTPATARNILRSTGSPQQNEAGRPASQRIGNRPNLQQAFDQLGIAGKNLIKDIKDGHKDKLEKSEIKEHKEKSEIFEVKNKDFIREAVKPGFGPGAGQSSGDLESRVANLEQTLSQLSHFIGGELRPDLQSSALNHEEDLTAISQQLEKEANDAKSMKDQKDIEKLRET